MFLSPGIKGLADSLCEAEDFLFICSPDLPTYSFTDYAELYLGIMEHFLKEL